MATKITTEIFIERARKVHGDKYDYSKVEYVNKKEKVCIICKEHGCFWQSPSDHIHGYGCPYCGGTKRKTTEEFVQQAKFVHKDKYDYSKVAYINGKTKVCIICPEHGEFWQQPTNHLNGQNCPICAKLFQQQKSFKTYFDFITEAKRVHGEKYDYSETKYVNYRTVVNIVCPSHGLFTQLPKSHLAGKGCPICAKNDAVKKRTRSLESFINEARAVHGLKYDYSQSIYLSATKKVCIICPEHGEFWQQAREHLKGHGCPACPGKKRKTTLSFITEAQTVHGDKYDYSKVEYVNARTHVCIVCPIHGEFFQTPSVHLRGSECPLCANEQRGVSSRKYTEEEIINIARQSTDISYFRTNYPTAYLWAIKLGIDLSFLDRIKRDPYSYDEVYKLAEKCKSRTDLQYLNASAYNIARKKGWLESFTWLQSVQVTKNDKHSRKHTVYVYEDKQNMVAYVGLTNNPIRRHYQHTHVFKGAKSNVKLYFEKIGKPVPSPRILEENLTPEQAQELENSWKLAYIDAGWTMLNKAKTGKGSGSLGAYVIKWTYEECQKLCEQYNNTYDLRMDNVLLYSALTHHGWLHDFFPQQEKRNFTYEYCKSECRKYKGRHELQKADRPLYRVCKKNGWLDEFYVRLRREYDLEICQELVKSYNFLNEVMFGDPGLYQAIRSRGWVEILFPYWGRSPKNNRRMRCRISPNDKMQ